MQIGRRIENDAHLPGRRSRKIEIVIKEEVIDNDLDKNKDERSVSDMKMKKWICEKYNDFCLNQDACPSNSGSPVKWRISKDLLGS